MSERQDAWSQASVQSAAIKSHFSGVNMPKLSASKAANRGPQVGIFMGGCLGFFPCFGAFLVCFVLFFCSKKTTKKRCCS